jgi:hypothetical protein
MGIIEREREIYLAASIKPVLRDKDCSGKEMDKINHSSSKCREAAKNISCSEIRKKDV